MLASLRQKIADNPWPVAIFSAAFLVRLIYIIEKATNDPSFAFPMVDELWHWRWANEILKDNFWGDEAWFRAPLYAYFLALLIKLTGMLFWVVAKLTGFISAAGDSQMAQLFAIRTLQALLAAWTASLVYRLGAETISRRVGAFAGLAYAFYGTLVFYDTMLLIPVLFIFLLVSATINFMRWLDQQQNKLLIYAGLLYGLAAIARPNILLVMPLLAAMIYLVKRDKKYLKVDIAFILVYAVVQVFVQNIAPVIALISLAVALAYIKGDKRNLFNLRHALRPALLLATFVSIPVFAVTLRNIIVTGETTLISTQGGVNLYLGNNPQADGLTMILPEIQLDESVSWSQFTVVTRSIAERESGRALTPTEQSEFWNTKAQRYIWSNPGQFLNLTWRKIVYLTLGFENSDNGNIYYNRNYSLLMSALLWEGPLNFPWGVIFPLALIGMVVGWSARKKALPLYLILFGYLPTIFLFLVTARHRTPLLPFVLIFAGIGIFYLVDLIRERRYSRLAVPAVACLALILLLNQNYYEIGFFNEGQVIHHQGITHERRQEWQKAEQSYREALEYDPSSHVIWNSLGFVLMRQNRIEEAAECYDKSTELGPNQIESLLNFGQMLAQLTSYEGAIKRFRLAAQIKPDDFRPIINMGDVNLRQRLYDSAEVYYRQAKQMAPEEKEVFFKLGELYARQKKYFEAETAFKRGAFFGKPSAIAYLNWGNVRFESGKTRDALAKYQQALRINPRLKQAWYSAGMCHYKLKSPTDSVLLYLEYALKLDPDLKQARDILEAIDPSRIGQ